MRVAVTGTPGTGKTTATELLESRLEPSDGPSLEVVHLNEQITEKGLYTETDEDRDSVVADMEAIADWLDGREDIVVESHLAHHLTVDRVAVLRCHPETLEARLRERGESDHSARENAESEALDVILSEAVEKHGQERVYEIETTDKEPDVVASALAAVISGDREPSAGTVDYLSYLA